MFLTCCIMVSMSTPFVWTLSYNKKLKMILFLIFTVNNKHTVMTLIPNCSLYTRENYVLCGQKKSTKVADCTFFFNLRVCTSSFLHPITLNSKFYCNVLRCLREIMSFKQQALISSSKYTEKFYNTLYKPNADDYSSCSI